MTKVTVEELAAMLAKVAEHYDPTCYVKELKFNSSANDGHVVLVVATEYEGDHQEWIETPAQTLRRKQAGFPDK